jgi:tetratricopeptide (TPR) repeat protein
LRFVLAALLVGITLGGGRASADDGGQDDLDKAIQAKLGVKTLSDLGEVVRLCESALKKGLDEYNTRFAGKLMASTLALRGGFISRSVYDSLSPDARWRDFRRAALEDLEKAVKMDPQQLESLYRIAELHLLPEGDRKRAAEALDEIVQRAKDEPAIKGKALSLRANLQKDPAKKLADLSAAIRIAPNDILALRSRAMHYLQKGDFETALADLNAALKLNPANPAMLEAKAMALARMKRFDEALATVELSRKLEPKSVAPLIERARINLLKPDMPAALKDLDEACKVDPTSPAALLMRASVLQEMNQNDKALADVERALKLQPGLEVAKRLRAILLAGGGKFNEAISEIEALLKARPDDEETQLQLAMLYSAEERFGKAIALYSKLLAKEPGNFAALRGRADALLGLGKHAEAIADYENAYRINPKDSGLLNNFAWVLSTSPFDKLRNGKRALEMAEAACKLTDYKQGHVLSTLAAAHAELGDFDSALKWSRKAVELGKEEQKEALLKELESYKARKPVRELKTGDKDDAPTKPGEKPATPTAKPPEKSKPPLQPKAKEPPDLEADPVIY